VPPIAQMKGASTVRSSENDIRGEIVSRFVIQHSADFNPIRRKARPFAKNQI
jgi:hypothetical protein